METVAAALIALVGVGLALQWRAVRAGRHEPTPTRAPADSELVLAGGRRAPTGSRTEGTAGTAVAADGADGGRTGGPGVAGSTPLDAGGRVVEGLRRRPWARRGLTLVSFGLVVGAVAMLGYPFYTNLYASREQSRLSRQLASPELEAAYQDDQVATGDALTRIRIPAIGVETVVVEGTTASALRAGAGHYPQTPLPCEAGNVAIAGHRTTYGRPFHDLDRLQAGDVIVLETPVGSCTYEIAQAPFVIQPTDTTVIAPTDEPALTLTTCHPKGSAARRLVVRANLVSDGSAEA